MLPETLLGLSLPLPALSSEELNLPLSTGANESQNGVRVRLSNLP
jgi:hypothetical protein